MLARHSIVAGHFYPADAEGCRRSILECTRRSAAPALLPGQRLGGVVPHAGWMCSGHVAAGVFQALAEGGAADTVVLFSAVHRWAGAQAAVFSRGAWETPMGSVLVDEALAAAVLAAGAQFVDAPEAHTDEHSLEVQAPFVRHFFPNARILPVMIPPNRDAVPSGDAVGGVLAGRPGRYLVVGTSDLTHYGPGYGFTPQGVGPQGLAWARNVNDRRMIDLILAMSAESVVAEAKTHGNACGAGAIAATIAAVRRIGADRACLVEQTTSREVLKSSSADAVGYAGVVFGK